MNNDLIRKVKRLTVDLKHTNQSDNKHFSFIVDKNKILAIGKNSLTITHPLAKRLKYRSEFIHSEMDCYLSLRWAMTDFSNCFLINTRINNLNEFGMCKPCKYCIGLIRSLNFKRVYFMDSLGEIKILNI